MSRTRKPTTPLLRYAGRWSSPVSSVTASGLIGAARTPWGYPGSPYTNTDVHHSDGPAVITFLRAPSPSTGTFAVGTTEHRRRQHGGVAEWSGAGWQLVTQMFVTQRRR